MFNTFNGYYFKHQKNGRTVALIPGVSSDGAFIQVLSDRCSYHFDFPSAVMKREIMIGQSHFSTKGVHIELPEIQGDIFYTDILPLKTDIMGPFRFFPMECRHQIVSMRHKLSGSLYIENELYDFEGGIGYMEGDSGRSFPKKYIWLQANDFLDGSSVMVSVAEIPFGGFHFQGCICVVMKDEKEYRLATYLGAKTKFHSHSFVIHQGSLRLEVNILSPGNGFFLASPQAGKMNGIIKENNHANVLFQLSNKDQVICELLSKNVGFECVGYPLS